MVFKLSIFKYSLILLFTAFVISTNGRKHIMIVANEIRYACSLSVESPAYMTTKPQNGFLTNAVNRRIKR
jgi:hypothetical protein